MRARLLFILLVAAAAGYCQTQGRVNPNLVERLLRGEAAPDAPASTTENLFGAPQVAATDLVGARDVQLADIDGDDDLDAVTAEMGAFSSAEDRFIGSQVSWYENDGSGGFTLVQAIATASDGAASVATFDFEGDGDVDVLAACSGDYDPGAVSYSGGSISWFKNDGTGDLGEEIDVPAPADGAAAIASADLNDDANPDAIAAMREDNKIVWFAGDGFLGFSGQKVVDTNVAYANDVVAADLDGDDLLDLVHAAGDDDKVSWNAYEGSGEFGEQQIINTEAFGVISVAAGDLDGDDDVDAVSASQGDDKVAWYRNEGGGNFGLGAPREITTATPMVEPIVLADFDQDGDLDVAAGDWGADRVTWYANDGAGNFGAQQVVATLGGDVEGLAAGDIDGDGDLDLIACTWDDNSMAWMENRLGEVSARPRDAAPSEFRLLGAYPNPFNPSTIARYELPEAANVRIAVYNALGERVALIADGRRPAGVHEAAFDAGGLSGGVYFLEFEAIGVSGETTREATKAILAK
jgi:hypothetical protein